MSGPTEVSKVTYEADEDDAIFWISEEGLIVEDLLSHTDSSPNGCVETILEPRVSLSSHEWSVFEASVEGFGYSGSN